MTKDPRTPLTFELVKGQGAVPEQIPDPPTPADPPLTVASAPPKIPTVGITVRMSEPLAERLRLLSIRTRRGKGDLIIEALTRFLDGMGA